MFPTKLGVKDVKAPEGVEYWPRGEPKYFEENFNSSILWGMRGFEFVSLELLTFRYNVPGVDVEKQVERTRTGMIRHWTDELYNRWCTPHSKDRDIAQFAAMATINDVECYLYPTGRVKRFDIYDEITFQVVRVEPLPIGP